MAKKNSPLKSLGTFFIALVAIICLAADGWFAYIHFFGKEQVASTTMTVSDMTVKRADAVSGEVTEDTKTFLEVNIFDNCFELKFNELYDENQTAFYSYGIQLIIKDGLTKKLTDSDAFDGTFSKSIYSEKVIEDRLEYNEKESMVFRLKLFYSYFNEVFTQKSYNYLDLYEYQSFDDYETPLQSTRLQDGDEFFKIQINEDGENKNFALSFIDYEESQTYDSMFNLKKSLKTDGLTKIGTSQKLNHSEDKFFSASYYFDKITYYRALDIYYLIESIADSTKGLAPGFVGETYLKMPDVFKLFRFNENTQKYERLGTEDAKVKLSASNVVYSKIKLTVHEGNLTKSSQSMFKKYRTIQNYDSDETQIDMTDYLSGKNLIIATLDDLDWKTTSSGEYYFSLSQEFRKRWSDYKNSSYVKVLIDKSFLETCNISLSSSIFEFDDEFFVYQITTNTGEILYKGVENV